MISTYHMVMIKYAPANIGPKIWTTALIVAFIEENFPGERPLWQLFCDEAKTLFSNPDIMKLVKGALFEN